MALINRETWPQHRPWALLALTGSIVAAVVYGLAASNTPWPTGSSPVGLSLGVIAALIMLFEFLLVVRKRYRRLRVGPVKTWLAAHVWLGLLTVPLAVLHSGFYLGGSLTIFLMVTFALVILSGLLGVLLQIVLPRRMMESLPYETVYSEIDTVIGSLRRDAQRLLWRVNPDLHLDDQAAQEAAETAADAEDEPQQDLRKVADYRDTGSVRGTVLQTVTEMNVFTETTADEDEGPLADFVHRDLVTFLRPNISPDHPLLSDRDSGALFRILRSGSDPSLQETISQLEGICRQRRDFARQRRMHHWLHGWLLLHLPLSVMLMFLLLAHIVFAVRYW